MLASTGGAILVKLATRPAMSPKKVCQRQEKLASPNLYRVAEMLAYMVSATLLAPTAPQMQVVQNMLQHLGGGSSKPTWRVVQ